MKSVLVIGMGRFGRHLANKMLELGNDVAVVDKNGELIERVSAKFKDSHIGDCTDEGVLRALGVYHYDICFVAIGEDFQASLVITSLLKRLQAKCVVAKTHQDIQSELLMKVGANEVVYPEREVSEKLAVRYNEKNIFDYIPLTGDYSIYEIPILNSWVGRTILEIEVRRKYGINIIAVKQGNTMHPMPGADYVFANGDHVVVMGKSGDVFKLAAHA